MAEVYDMQTEVSQRRRAHGGLRLIPFYKMSRSRSILIIDQSDTSQKGH